jgi:Carboxypeptidase regulatory-like domain/TonB dependent receptor
LTLRWCNPLAIFLAVVFLGFSANAQVTTADVVGTVHDPTGAVVAGANVEAKNLSTGLTRNTQTGASGDYVINLLPPGTYSVTVEAPSFKTFRVPSLTLASGDRSRVDATMQAGQNSESVDVTATTPLLQTDTATLSSTVTEQAVQDLPLNGRNFVQLAQQVPGANEGPPAGLTSGTRPDDRRQTSAISVNGQSDVINNEMIDGMDNNERIIGGIGVRPSVDAIAEFTVQTNDYTAEVGRTAGGVINVITKSGSNNLHGSIYEYFRNDKFDAHSFFDLPGSPKPELRQNQYGASIGGPIIKDKTFFFGDYEGFRLVSGQSSRQLTVPTLFEEQHPGNFSDVGGPVITTIDPVGLEYFKMFPAPNTGGAGATANNFTTPALNKTQNSSTFDIRVDHHFNNNNSLFARYTYNNVTTFIPGAFPIVTINGVKVNPGGLFFGFSGPAPDKAQQAQLDYTHVFSSTLLLELRAGYLRTNNGSFPLNFGTNVSQKLGMPGVNVDPLDSGLSQVTFDNGVAPLGDDQFVPISDIDNTYQGSGTVTYTRGRQNIKVGSTLIRRLATEGQSNSGVGTWAFPDLPTLLTGVSRVTTRINELAVPHYRFWEPSVFIQDDWRVKDWLTLNLGVRYEVFTPMVEEKNRMANFDPVTARIILAGVNGVSRGGGINTQYNNVAPRFGFAATVAPGTVVRGGYGISYVPMNYTSNVTQKNPPFISSFVYNGTRALSQGLQPPVPASATAPTSIPDAVALNFKNTAIQQFNLNVQKDFAGNVLTVAYVGMLGRHIGVTIGDLDFPFPGPGNGACLALSSTAAQTACLQPRRPFARQLPSLTGPIGEYFTSGNSTYNALQTSFERRLQNGLTFNINYTWAHGIDDVTGLSNENGDGLDVIPNLINKFDRGNSDVDIRHRIAATADYAIPFGNSLKGVEGGFGKGWQVNIIDIWETSVPFSILNPNPGRSGAHFFGGNTDRPNRVSDPNLSNPGVGGTHLWFNPAAFARQTLGAIGTEGKNQMYGPHFRHFDFSVFKDFRVTENSTLQFRTAFFNLTNTPSFANPGGTLGQASFGHVTNVSQNYTPRQIQFVLKFLF